MKSCCPRACCPLRLYLPRQPLTICKRAHPPVCAVNRTAETDGAGSTRTPAAKAAIFTGLYATLGGVALCIAPVSVFSLLFDASSVPQGWIRVGGEYREHEFPLDGV